MKKLLLKFNRTLATPVLNLLLLSLGAAFAGEPDSRRETERRASLGSGEHGEPSGRAMPGAPTASAIPWSELGAQAGAQYHGDGLSVTATEDGARLLCVFQKLEGQVTPDGLWLFSTDADQRVAGSLPATDGNDRFRVTAKAFGRETLVRELPHKGSVSVQPALARFDRPGVIEEYSVSADGVRQDFVIAEPPPGDSRLLLELEVTGAQAESSPQGARLVLPSGRRIAYSRLHVTDATGRELTARIEVTSASSLRVFVDDAMAAYPVRVDPTFSDDNWISMGGLPGTNGRVFAMTVDGLGNLYVTGEFTVIGQHIANRIAKWDGNTWSALGSGLSTDGLALAVSGNNLYAGGRFTMAGGQPASHVAQWNGSDWTSLGAGVNAEVLALATHGDRLYVAGRFTQAGAAEAGYIAKWQGGVWLPLGSGMDAPVTSVAVWNGDLYAGGHFRSAGGVFADYLAKWNGSAWSPLGIGMSDRVLALAVADSGLIAGGYFGTAGGQDVGRVARWDGIGWSPLSSGVTGSVFALAASGDDVFVGGNFLSADGQPANRVARWDGNTWHKLKDGADAGVLSLAVVGGTVFAGGEFGRTDGKPAYQLSTWDGNEWNPIVGNSGTYLSLAVSGSDLYAAGYLTSIAGHPADAISKWDGNGWTPLNTGLLDGVRVLATVGESLYAGGDFREIGGITAKAIARRDGESWAALGTGIEGRVQAIATVDTDVYVGGSFTNAGGILANRVAKWNGHSWSALGSGMDKGVLALATTQAGLYAGGDFETAGGNPASFVARWDGNEWTPLGAGVDGSVFAIVELETDLFVGGSFSHAGGAVANLVARWDGVAWSPLGSELGQGGPFAWVADLEVVAGRLYACGSFAIASSEPLNNIAMWDGSAWHPLGSGTDGRVLGLANYGAELILAGGFSLAGARVSSGLARFVPALADERVLEINWQLLPDSASVSWPTSSVPFQLESATAVGAVPGSWLPIGAPPVVENGTNRVTVPNAGSQFFRLKYP